MRFVLRYCVIAYFLLSMMIMAAIVQEFFPWHDASADMPVKPAREVSAENTPSDKEKAEPEKKSGLAAVDTAAIDKILGTPKEGFSIYYMRPDGEDEPYIYNDKGRSPASMIKLFVMAAVMDEVHAGNMTLDEQILIDKKNVVGGAGKLSRFDAGKKYSVEKLLALMIEDSDNTATNVFIDKLGIDNINSYMAKNGYDGTKLYNKMMQRLSKESNVTTAKDVGALLTKIYKSECVGKDEDAKMLELLGKQHDTECFPKALPDYKIAHKVGEADGSYNAGGIFEGAKGNFVLVVLSKDTAGRNDAVKKIQEVAKYGADMAKKQK